MDMRENNIDNSMFMDMQENNIDIHIEYIYGTYVGNIFNILPNIFNNGGYSRNWTERDKNNSNTVSNNVYDSSNDGDIVSGNKADRSRRQYNRNSVVSSNIINVTTGNGRNKHNGDSDNIRGTLGQSKGDAFMGLGSAFGMVAGGLAMMGGAKLDELKEGNTKETGSELFGKESNAKEDNNSSKYSDKEIIAKQIGM